jgi:aminoglycoside phosphotransferase (APT) family kinase protein
MSKQWTADIPITERLVQDVLERQFPQLVPIHLQPLGEGWDNSLFLVNETYVFRFPRRTIAVGLIKMENRLLPALSPHLPIPIPNPCFIGQPTTAYPFPFSGYPKVSGTVPYMLHLTDAQRTQSAVRWAEFLRTLHGIPKHDALEWGIARSDYIGRMDVDKRIPMFIAKVEEAHNQGLIDNPYALLQITQSLPTTDYVKQQQCSAVVHGDLNFRNFLVNDDGVLSGVIDWGDAHIGHPAVDLSVVYSFLPSSARPLFWKAYGEVRPETRLLAKFRSLYTNIVILIHAHDIGDTQQLFEAKRAIALCTEELQ